MAKSKHASAMPADELRKERLALGLTQVELAKELGVAEVTIRKWEAGDNPISPLVVRVLATLQPRPPAPPPPRWTQRKGKKRTDLHPLEG